MPPPSVFNGLEGSIRLGTSTSLMLQGTTSNSTNAPNHLKRSLRAASSKRDLCLSEGCPRSKSSQSGTCYKHESVLESWPQIFANYQSTSAWRSSSDAPNKSSKDVTAVAKTIDTLTLLAKVDGCQAISTKGGLVEKHESALHFAQEAILLMRQNLG